MTACYTLVSGQTNRTIDAGIYQSKCVGDFVWEDLNRDGIQNDGATGLSNVVVELHACGTTNILSTTITDTNGFYQFCNLTAGVYRVTVRRPAGYLFTLANRTNDNCLDSDADANGVSECVDLTGAGTNNFCLDIGLYRPAAIGDFVWQDNNTNGLQDVGEPGVGGVQVKLMDCAGNVLRTTNTAANGSYLFTDLVPTNYNVMFVLPGGYVFTTPNLLPDDRDSDATLPTGMTACYTLVSGQTNRTVDAGLIPTPGICVTKEIACLLPGDNCGPFGKAALGYRSLSDLPAFCYSITISNCGNTILTNITATDDQLGSLTSVFFPNPPATLAPGAAITRFYKMAWAIDTTNTVTVAGRSVVNGATVSDMDSAVAMIDSASIVCLSTVTSPSDKDGNPTNNSVQLTNNGNANVVTFRTIICNNGQADLANVVITSPLLSSLGCSLTGPAFLPAGACFTNTCIVSLTCAQLPITAAVTVTGSVDTRTNRCGYTLSGTNIMVSTACQSLVTCQPCPTNCVPLTPCTPPYPFASANPRTSIDFNESEVLRGFTVSVTNGCMPKQIRVFYNDEHALVLGVRRVIVKTAGGNTTNDYPITALNSNPGSALNPLVGSTILTGDQAGTDVSDRPLYPALFITDITSDPMSLAGDWQYGGTAIPPHAVFGTWKGAVRIVDKTRNPVEATVTPDADPAKNNWNLGNGDPVPAGLVNQGFGAEVRWETDQLGLLPGHIYRLYFMVHDGDQNKDGGDTGQACVNLNTGVAMDCGTNVIGAIGDYVWRDLNTNGLQDAGEPGVSNVIVQLTDCMGMTLRTTTTDVSGRYLFGSLSAGSYRVKFMPPAGFTFTMPNMGIDDTKDSDTEIVTGLTGCYVLMGGQTNLTVDAGLVVGCRANVVVAVECQDASGLGQPITFSGWISNLGEGAVTNVTLSHSVSGLVKFFGTLAPGVTTKFSGSYVPSDCGDITSSVTLTGRDTCTGSLLTIAEEFRCNVPCFPQSCLRLVKTADKFTIGAGDQATYTYVISNGCGVTLTNVVVRDDNGSPDFAGDDFIVGTVATLLAGQSHTFTKALIPPVQLCLRDMNGVVGTSGLLITEILTNGNIKATFIQSMAVNDNTYGANAINWPGGHTFGNLTGSDQATWSFKDANGNEVLSFKEDYITATAGYPSGYGTLGVLGGDGGMLVGNATNVLYVNTSLTDNLNKQPFLGNLAQYTVNSPSLADPNSALWEYRMIYTVIVNKTAFGAAGFGSAMIADQHNSPTKPPFERGPVPFVCDACVTNIATVTAIAAGQVQSSQAGAIICVTNKTGGVTGGRCPEMADYWKKNPSLWPAPYTSAQTVVSVFAKASLYADASNKTLLQALDGKAGSNKDVKDLLKEAVAAVLNSSTADINYPLTTADIITGVDMALMNGTSQALKSLKDLLKEANEARGCQ